MAQTGKDVTSLIGVPFKYGGRGPDSFDCYGLVKHLLERDGVVLPDYVSPHRGPEIAALMHGNIHLWSRCELKPGCVLAFRLPAHWHCAYYLGDDQFIHTWEQSGGVCIERLGTWKRLLMGCYEYRTAH